MAVKANLAADGIVAATGVIGLVVAWRYLRCRAVHPDLADPAVDAIRRIKIFGVVAVALVIAANVAAVSLIPIDYLFFTLAGLLALDAVIAYFGIGLLLTSLFDAYASRRRTRYVICELDYRGAPRTSKSTLRRIYRYERQLSDSHAVKSGVLGDVEANRLVYSAAEQAIAAAEINHAIGELKPASTDEDRLALADAQSALADIKRYIEEIEAALKAAAGTADATTVRPAQARNFAATESAAHPVPDDRARNKVTETVERSRLTPRVDTVDFSDRVSSMSYGHEEAQRISRGILDGPDLEQMQSTGEATPTEPHAVRTAAAAAGRVAGRAASKAAGAAAEASLSGAEYTVAKLRTRLARRNEKDQQK